MVTQLEIDLKEIRLWSASLIPLQLLAIASTVFRFIHRKRNQGLWWDDHLALFSAVLAFISFLTPWSSLIQGRHPALHIASGLLFILSFNLCVWISRISLALSIARVMPRRHPIVCLIICIVLFFAALCVALLVVQLTDATARDTAWTFTPPYTYIPSHSIGILILCADLIGDMLLITIPLPLFWNAKLQPLQLFLVKIGFAASILTSITSIICIVVLLVPKSSDKMDILTGLTRILISVALIACNALVIITFLYRFFKRLQGEQPNMLTTTTNPSEPNTLPSTETPSTRVVLTDLSDSMQGGRHTFSY